MGPTFLFPFAKKKELPNFLIPPLRGYISPPFLSRHSVFRRPSCENRRCRLWDPQSHCSAASPHRSAQSHAIPDRWPPGGEGRLEVFSGFGGRLLLFFFGGGKRGENVCFETGPGEFFGERFLFGEKNESNLKLTPKDLIWKFWMVKTMWFSGFQIFGGENSQVNRPFVFVGS